MAVTTAGAVAVRPGMLVLALCRGPALSAVLTGEQVGAGTEYDIKFVQTSCLRSHNRLGMRLIPQGLFICPCKAHSSLKV